MRETQSFLLFFTGLCCLRPCRPLQYHFVDAALPWSMAQSYCRTTFTDLATVPDAASTELLANAAAQLSGGGFAGKAWIGLRDNLTNWRWSLADAAHYGRRGGSFRNWDSGQPDNFFGDQMCAKTFIGGAWEDSRCVLRNPFVCYDGAAVVGKRFVFVAQQLSWSDAQRHCRRRYTDLASVRNRDENEQILRLSGRGAWIGLHRTRDWSDGSESSFRYWTGGQPDNAGGKQSCVAANLGNAGRWSDEECGRSLAFVCYGERVTTTEKPSTTTPLTETTPPSPPSTALTKPILAFTDESPNETTSSSSDATTRGKSTTTTTERDSTAPGFTSSVQFETSKLDQTTSTPGELVIRLGLKFTSKAKLSEDDVEELVFVEFHKRLLELGLPSSLKVVLKKPRK